MLAVLEHLDHPIEIVKEIERILKPKGKLILTVPSRNSKPVLEFLAYKLKIQKHRYFQFYMNNFCIASKEI